MAQKILIHEADKHQDKSVLIEGWVVSLRSSGKIIFLQLRDGTGTIQGIVSAHDVSAQLFKQAQQLTQESSLSVTGTIKKEPRSPSGYDLLISNLKVINLSPEPYPLGKKDHGASFLLNHRHLWLRSPRQRAIQVIRYQIITSIYDFYKLHQFIKIDTPIITPTACEGTTTLFEVDYFGKPAYLSQSGQLYLEAAIFSVNRCFDFAPVFRAEKSKTRRHLIEFWMNNAEVAFFNHQQNLEIQEQLIHFILQSVLKDCQQELAILERNLQPLEKIQLPFPRLSYHQAIEKLHQLGSDIKTGQDLGNDDETLLMAHYHQPIFIQYFPVNIKAFYMKRHPQDNSLALCADLLAPEGYGEIIGGSQREDDYQLLKESIENHHLPLKEFSWYLDLRRYGSVPHSGFGLGLERMVAWVCGLKHVRETIPFPRLLNRIYP